MISIRGFFLYLYYFTIRDVGGYILFLCGFGLYVFLFHPLPMGFLDYFSLRVNYTRVGSLYGGARWEVTFVVIFSPA